MKTTFPKFLRSFTEKSSTAAGKAAQKSMKNSEIFVCASVGTLPIQNEVLSKSKYKDLIMSQTRIPLPFDDFIVELNATADTATYISFVHVTSDPKCKTLAKLTAYAPILGDDDIHGYISSTYFIKATSDQRWKRFKSSGIFNVYGMDHKPTSYYEALAENHEEELKGTLAGSALAVMSFLQVMSANNTSTVLNKISKLKKMRSKGFAKDFYTVNLKAKKVKTGNDAPAVGSEPISPHTRRSHLRHYANGSIIVIPSSMVNAHLGAASNKEYVF